MSDDPRLKEVLAILEQLPEAVQELIADFVEVLVKVQDDPDATKAIVHDFWRKYDALHQGRPYFPDA